MSAAGLSIAGGSIAFAILVAGCGGDAASATREPVVDSGFANDTGVDAQPEIDAPPSTSSSYDADGVVPFAVTTEKVNTGSKTFDVTVYMPTSAGLHPLVGFAPGNSQSAEPYLPYAKRLATHGIATILRGDPGTFTRTTDIATELEFVIGTWMPTALAGKVDTARVGLAGHSRGGAVSLIAAERTLKGKVVAWFGLDPVDNQFGASPGAYARSEIGKIGVPTAYLGASIPSNCAPDADGYKMLYPASPSPSVLIVGVGAGHTQFGAGTCSLCAVCTGPGTADGAVVLAYSLRYLTAFFARELLGDKSVGARFEGAGLSADLALNPVTVESK